MNQDAVPPVPPPLPDGQPFTYEPPGRRKASMLAWWAAIPLVCFVVIEAVFGWRVAVARASAPDFAVSYFGGSLVGGLLLSLLCAYVAYRIGSRSQFSATFTFTVVLLVLCSGVIRQAKRAAHVGAASGGGSMAQSHAYATFRFETAGAWRELPPSKQKTAAFLVLAGESPARPRGMIMVDTGRPVSDVRQTASSLAAPDGRVLSDPTRVDGAEGVRVETASTDLSRPKLAVVLLRGGQMYLIMAANGDGYDVTPDFERVLQSWKWKEDATGGVH